MSWISFFISSIMIFACIINISKVGIIPYGVSFATGEWGVLSEGCNVLGTEYCVRE